MQEAQHKVESIIWIEISPNEKKIEELLGREYPKTKKELQSVLESLNQLTQWILSAKVKIPGMRKMIGANNKFNWLDELEEEIQLMSNLSRRQPNFHCLIWQRASTSIVMPATRELYTFLASPIKRSIMILLITTGNTGISLLWVVQASLQLSQGTAPWRRRL